MWTNCIYIHTNNSELSKQNSSQSEKDGKKKTTKKNKYIVFKKVFPKGTFLNWQSIPNIYRAILSWGLFSECQYFPLVDSLVMARSKVKIVKGIQTESRN